uniref:Formate C-acetyltransferase n=1 Tax=Steinernema glaseri TaxID=37863 RepID=A0A1I7ZH66_9BILA
MDQLKQAYKANFIAQALMTMMMGPFLFPDTAEDDPKARLKNAQLEKLYLRAHLAAEDAVEYFKEIPVEKFIDNP